MRNLIILSFLWGVLFAVPRPTSMDLQLCFERHASSIVNYKGHRAYALSKDKGVVVYDKDNKLRSDEYIKFDTHLGLYLVNLGFNAQPLTLFDENVKKSTWVAVPENNTTIMGHIKSYANGLGEFDELSFNPKAKGLLISGCCKVFGIVTHDNRFVGSRYLRHFMSYDDVYYGDIGAIFEEKDGFVFVKSVNLFGVGKNLMVGDKIIAIDNEKITNLRQANEKILFSSGVIKIEVEREGINEVYDLRFQNQTKDEKLSPKVVAKSDKVEHTTTQISSQFFKNYGLSFDKNMVVTAVKVDSKAHKDGIKKRDKLMQIDKKPVKNLAQANKIMLEDKNLFYLLFSRNDFQFFVRAYK